MAGARASVSGSAFLADGGETGALIRALDWSATPLGPPEGWPSSLKTAVSLLLTSAGPVYIGWGPDLTSLYNDGYLPIVGAKHPGIGLPFAELWAEIWDEFGPIVAKTMAGEAQHFVDLPIALAGRPGRPVGYFTFSYTPLRDDEGRIAGFYCAATETTDRVLADERRAAELERQRRMFAQAPGFICTLEGPDHVFTFVNNAHVRLFGDRALVGKSVREGFPELEGQGFYELLDRVYATGERHVAQAAPARVRTGTDGPEQDRFLDFIYEPMLDVDGRVFGVFCEGFDVTDAHRAHETLRESEARFRLMADAVPQIVWITDADGRVEFFNKHWSDYTGATYDPATAAEVAAGFVHPDDAGPTIAAFDEARRTGGVFHVEHRIRSASGDYRWFLVRGEPYPDPSTGEVTRWFGASVDIHDRKLAEEQLRALNQTLEQRVAEALAERKLLADLVENTDAFVQVADTDFRWLAINRAAADEFERIYGVRPKVGDSMLDLLADKPEHQAAVRAVWGRALAGEAFTETGEFGDPGRERRCYEMKYHVLRGADGERIGAYQFVYEVTKRVREQQRLAEAEAARREADALYRAYFENSPEALFVIGVEPDGGFVIEQVNPAHEAGVGFKLAEVRGKRIEEILPPDVAEQVLATYRHVVTTGAIYQYREVFDLNGDAQHWDTSLVPVRNADGSITRLIGSSRNVTRQVVAEEALRQAQKMEAMGQLTGGVAHDFNNLLTPIVGSLDMLQRRGLGGEREQRLIAGAMQSAERAKTLVQRLLAFARRQPLQSVPVDVAKLVTGMGDLVASTTGPQIKVVVEAVDDLNPAMADPNQLEMALLNLAVNARDAMPEGGTLRISASAERVGAGHLSKLRAGRYIRLSVADTGTGMDEATLARAVEPFFSTKGIGKGTGLGLSMVHGLASQLGGALNVRSRPGLGTNVELWLPESTAAPEPAEPVSEPSAAVPGRGTALLVDDEDLVRLSTADMLNDLGYQVIEAASAEEAMRLVEGGERFDLLVTDHLMPGMNGTDLARTIRTAKPGVLVLLVSGYAESDGIAADLPRLTKPFRKDELASSLAQISTSG